MYNARSPSTRNISAFYDDYIVLIQSILHGEPHHLQELLKISCSRIHQKVLGVSLVALS